MLAHQGQAAQSVPGDCVVNPRRAVPLRVGRASPRAPALIAEWVTGLGSRQPVDAGDRGVEQRRPLAGGRRGSHVGHRCSGRPASRRASQAVPVIVGRPYDASPPAALPAAPQGRSPLLCQAGRPAPQGHASQSIPEIALLSRGAQSGLGQSCGMSANSAGLRAYIIISTICDTYVIEGGRRVLLSA